MLVNFAKMHGLGNDFVVIDRITQSLRLHSDQIQRIADRHRGIGCDQIILIEPPIHKHSDFYYRIYNANGEEVEQCGNGARCAARFFYDSGYINSSDSKNTPKNNLPNPPPYKLMADCLAGPIEFTIEEEENVSVNMGKPIFSPTHIPLNTEHQQSSYSITLDVLENPTHNFFAVSMGNPHAILVVPNIDTAPVHTLGPLFAKHPFFPNSTNVEFMQILNPSHIRLRVYERGVGETLACGTGACAAVVAGIQQKLLTSPVKVSFNTGDLIISWDDSSKSEAPVIMKGPATTVFVGRFRV